MCPKDKERKPRKRKRLGPWYQVGRICVIAGAVLIIVAAILDIINYPTGGSVWESYTFGNLGIPILGGVIAIVMAVILLWIGIDNRFAYSINLILLAIIIAIIAIIAGNVGALLVIIGAILIIFEELAKSS